MAFDAYLQIDGIKGESTDKDHKDWIEVLTYSKIPPLQTAATLTARATPSRPASHAEIIITKFIDVASPKLYQAASTGKHFKKAQLDLTRASGGTRVKYMTIELHQVIISRVTQGAAHGYTPLHASLLSLQAGSPTGSAPPVLATEELTLKYGAIKWTYTQQGRSDGSGGGNVAGR
ncbi:type VI secretion system tube protein Hcp [Acidobacteria bacterium AB60]|nr:type VI secretion system tube protein Hcp [Acidobacteria bacterium AB60]